MSSIPSQNPTPSSANDRQVGGNHYSADFQHWDFVPLLGLCWQEGCGTKYLARIFKKHASNPTLVIQDMEKVLHYVEKHKELLDIGVVHAHQNSPEYRAYHTGIYQAWIRHQNFGTDNPKLLQSVFEVLMTYSEWSWDTTSPHHGLTRVSQQVALLIAEYKAYLKSLTQASDPVSQEAPPAEMRAYQQQSIDPVQPKTSSVQVPQPAQLEATGKVQPTPEQELQDALIQQSRLSLQMLIQNQPLSTPVDVYYRLLEDLRRFTDVVPLDLSPRVTAGGEDRETYSSFRDYAEALNKISLGVRTLDESLPNAQLSRTAVAMWAVLDGITNLQHWMLRLTEGDNPILKDEAQAHFVRLQLRKCTAVLHQNALAYLSSKGIDPGVYTLGSARYKPVNAAQQG
jgi:hypothetical protein